MDSKSVTIWCREHRLIWGEEWLCSDTKKIGLNSVIIWPGVDGHTNGRWVGARAVIEGPDGRGYRVRPCHRPPGLRLPDGFTFTTYSEELGDAFWLVMQPPGAPGRLEGPT